MKKKNKGFRTAVIMPLFIVIIMVMSAFGYMWGSARTSLNYNGFKFYQLENTGFMLKLDKQRIAFNYYPSELEWINSTKGISAMLNTPMVYATYDPESDYADSIAEVQFNFGQIMDQIKGVYVQNAFISETEYDIPVVTCANATPAVPVVNIQISNSTEIISEYLCVTINAKNRQELFMAYERLLYTLLGVME